MSKSIEPKNYGLSGAIYIFQTHNISVLEGHILTFIDASISDPVQRKALKDLLRPMVWNWAIENNVESYYELKQKSVGSTPMGNSK